jgi:methylmalonyl-CoA/ethylmalonyl-CoA epimerase
MITRISHVGIVVGDLENSLRLYEKLFHLKPSAVVDALNGKVRAAFVPIGAGEIELLQPIDPGLALSEFVRDRGPVIHHISLATDDIESEVDRLRKEGVVFDREKPTVGAHGTRIIFTVPKSTDGVAIELMEEPHADRQSAIGDEPQPNPEH